MCIIRLLQNILYIIEGYSIWCFNIITGKTREIAKYRISICNECKYNKKGICELCGCIIKAKARVDFDIDEDGKSIDGCPDKKW
ncbi:MAG: hypothetical protein [Wendovervirus sonii]|uniref:Uncharacterized protein n=1 Tax=phage Lak_Megaphage_Sonny TaxID=3109229 RepID=A0ABZ0Z5G5_9CAUD|nr:MAG: hypothetical protein [phage Lak_Megaphage_Sonny]